MLIRDEAELTAIYGDRLAAASVVKEVDHLIPHYKALVEASPFVILATSGPGGLDCSPRGDHAPVARVLDERTLAIPDRRGNNRIDSLRNIIRDPRVALLFLLPGSGTTFRVNGRAAISVEPELLKSFETEDRQPRTVILVSVEAAYFQCARAIVRARLWDLDRHVDPGTLPTPGAILAHLSDGDVGGRAYDEEWPDRAKATLW